jgi:Transcription factor WhiB
MNTSINVGKYLSTPTAPQEWREHAACAGTAPTPDHDPWFPITSLPHARTEETATALRICGTCTVRQECLQDAIKSGEQHGIRAGRDFTTQPACRLCETITRLYTTGATPTAITEALGHPAARLTGCLTRHGNHAIARDLGWTRKTAA